MRFRLFYFFALFFYLPIDTSNLVFANDYPLSVHYEHATSKCHDIACIRSEMDRINEDIIKLLTERTAYVKRAGDLKSNTSKVADDRKRVADQEVKITELSKKFELPLEISLPAFREIMENSIQFQQKYINTLIQKHSTQ